MRSSTLSMYQKNVQSMLTAQANLQKSGMHLSSEKRILTPSDDPVAAAEALALKQLQGRNQQMQSARKEATDRLSRQETVLSDITKVIHNIKEKLVLANKDTFNDTNREAVKKEIENYKAQLLALGNATDNHGNYLFGGYKNTTPPFKITGDEVEYVGSQDPIKIAINDTREVAISVTGETALMPSISTIEGNIFKSIDVALSALSTQSTDPTNAGYRDKITAAAKGIDSALNHNLGVRTEGGALLAELEQLIGTGETFAIDYKIQISEREGVDLYEAISDLFMLQASLQATQQIFSFMQNMSLFQQK